MLPKETNSLPYAIVKLQEGIRMRLLKSVISANESNEKKFEVQKENIRQMKQIELQNNNKRGEQLAQEKKALKEQDEEEKARNAKLELNKKLKDDKDIEMARI